MQHIVDIQAPSDLTEKLSETDRGLVRKFLLGISVTLTGVIVFVLGVGYFGAYIAFWPHEYGGWAFIGVIIFLLMGSCTSAGGVLYLQNLFDNND